VGHKVHPVGFRLGVIKDWQSKWYSDTHYSEYALEDARLRDAIRAKYREAGISLVEIDRQAKDVTLTLHTARPGIVIGRGGQRVDEMRLYLEGLIGKRFASRSWTPIWWRGPSPSRLSAAWPTGGP
jgi:small subunit ribosomal protein S3